MIPRKSGQQIRWFFRQGEGAQRWSTWKPRNLGVVLIKELKQPFSGVFGSFFCAQPEWKMTPSAWESLKVKKFVPENYRNLRCLCGLEWAETCRLIRLERSSSQLFCTCASIALAWKWYRKPVSTHYIFMIAPCFIGYSLRHSSTHPEKWLGRGEVIVQFLNIK
jgi:hypothetical protein